MDVRVQLLGEVRVRMGDQRLLPPPDKRLGLLGYLACAGTWVDRDRLAWLFWPDVPNDRARSNLRGLLTRTRRAPYAAGVEAQPGRVRWLVDCDVVAFRASLAREAWSEAVNAYGGSFFGGATLDGAGAMSGWIEEERERLRAEHRRAVLACAATAGGRGADAAVAIAALDALLEEDPYDEEVARHALGVRASAGRRDEALRLAERLRGRLRDELDAVPSEETERAIARLERSAPLRTSPGTTGRTVALTPFVGRRAERRELAERLTQDDCRLLTLTGPGGVGKTRLAGRVAVDVAERFRDGAHVVSVASARGPQDVATAVADALNLPLAADEAAERAVVHALADVHALLVLDDLDLGLAAAPWLAELLSSCPATTLLVTSRQRLDLPAEWVVRLAGLERPAPDAPPAAVREADAVRLFVDAAVRVQPGFESGEEELAAVLRICRTVGGLPLALELAAAWVRALPVGELARELEGGIELLRRTPQADRDRHHSVRAAFEHSWNRLDAAEAEVFAALGSFRGAFGREAAAAVAGASITTLAALVDRSLVRLSPDGRYDRHPLLSRFAREKLAQRPELERRSRERHAAYFADWIAAAFERFERTGDVAIGRETAAAYDDLSAVLEEAITAGNTALAARIAGSLGWYWIWRGRSAEGRAWIDRVRGMRFPTSGLAEAKILQLAAVLSSTNGDVAEALALAGRAHEAAVGHDDVNFEAECLNSLGFIANLSDDVDTAMGHFERALSLADGADLSAIRMVLLVNAGACATRGGDEAGARDLLARAQALAAEHGNDKVMGLAHLHRGRLERQLRHRREARRELDRAFVLVWTARHSDLLARVQLHLALTAVDERDVPAAAPLLDACLVSWWEAGAAGRVPDALRAAAALCARAGDPKAAGLLGVAGAALAPGPASMLLPSERALLTSAIDEGRAAGPERFEEGAAAGANVGAAAAVAVAREVLARLA